jgi:uncharacterized protein YacL
MILHILRALFILLMGAVAWNFLGNLGWLTMAFSLALALLFVGVDILSPRRKLALFSGVLFGLAVGVAISFALGYVVDLISAQVITLSPRVLDSKWLDTLTKFIKLVVAIVCCYLSISFVLQTKDDFRFIIPYVEFSRTTKGTRPTLLDTSVLIDGRISDIAETGFFESQLVVPRFVLQELQMIADSGDKLKRNRGRRGLDVLTKLRDASRADVIIYEGVPHHHQHYQDVPEPAEDKTVDEKLLALAKELNGRVVTTDYNLNKVAQLRGVDVLNINDIAHALKPVALPGERMTVKLMKAGEAAGQGVGYLEDGTMVVVEQGRGHINEEVDFTVTSALQTSAGRMIFGRLVDGTGAGPAAPTGLQPPRRSPSRQDSPTAAS